MPFKLTTIGLLMAAAITLTGCIIIVDEDDDDDDWKDSRSEVVRLADYQAGK